MSGVYHKNHSDAYFVSGLLMSLPCSFMLRTHSWYDFSGSDHGYRYLVHISLEMGMQMDVWTSLHIWQALQMRAYLDCPKSTICFWRIYSAEYKKNIRQRFLTWDLEVPGESRFELLWKNAPDFMDLVWNCKYTYRIGHFLVGRKSITLTKFSVDFMIVQRLIEVVIVTSLVLHQLCWELSIPLSLVMTNISDDLSKTSLRKKVLFFTHEVNFLFNQTPGHQEGASMERRLTFPQLALFSFTDGKLSEIQVECNPNLLKFIASDLFSSIISFAINHSEWGGWMIHNI